MSDEAKPTPEVPVPVPQSASTKPSAGHRARGFLFQYFGSLLMEPNGVTGRYVMSIGRVALVAVLALCMHHWKVVDRDIVPGLKETLFALMGYNFGTKGLALAKEALDTWKTGKSAPPAPPPPEEGQ